MIQGSILHASPTPAGKENCVDPALRSRLELVYSHYAAVEPPSRFRKAPLEPTLTVRGYVRILTDAGLLPPNCVVSFLLAQTLPSYYLASQRALSSGQAESTFHEAPDLASMAMSGSSEAAKPNEAAELDEVSSIDVAATEILLNLSLIFAEFEECMLKFAELNTALVPPWVPPEPKVDEEALLAVAELGSFEESQTAPVGDQLGAGEAAPAEEGFPIDAAAALRDAVLPRVGEFLVDRLCRLAFAA